MQKIQVSGRADDTARKNDDDKRLFTELMKKARPAAIRYAYRLCYSSELVEDIVQEASAVAWKNFRQLRDKDSFNSWFMRIVKNTSWSNKRITLRRSTLAPVVEADMETLIDQGTDSRTIIMSIDVNMALVHLPPEVRQEWLLNVLGGVKARELGEMRSCSRASVEKRIERVRKNLAEILGMDYKVDFTYKPSSDNDKSQDNKKEFKVSVTHSINMLMKSRYTSLEEEMYCLVAIIQKDNNGG